MAVTITNDLLYYLVFSIWLITAFTVHYLIKSYTKPHETTVSNPPPAPPAFPFIGHLHLIGKVLPKSLQALSTRYGPLISIRLGASHCVVASNADVAKQIFKTQELNFCSRPEFGASEYFIYRGSRFILAQYGDYWRFMKKLCMTRLLSVPQLHKFVDVREEEKIKLLESVMKCCVDGQICDIGGLLTTFTNNVICRMAMSTRCSGDVDEGLEIKEIVKTCLQLAGKVHVGDVLGPLKMFDFSGNGNKLMRALLKFDRILEKIINQHEENNLKGFDSNPRKDLMDILLEVYNDPTELKLTRKDIKSFFLDIFMAGTDTSSAAMQWAIANLINNPSTFQKLRDEIDAVVGPNRIVNEMDIENLPYLRAVIRETLRLHPSAPLIIRECGEDCTINGWSVKAKTRVLVNIYAVMRDPELWSEPDEFRPERFLGGSGERIGEHQMEYKGQNFRFLPFGSGRRGCAGASLAMVVMHAAVGALVQCFDWKVKDGCEKVDLSQGPGFASELANPLMLYPIKRVEIELV